MRKQDKWRRYKNKDEEKKKKNAPSFFRAKTDVSTTIFKGNGFHCNL